MGEQLKPHLMWAGKVDTELIECRCCTSFESENESLTNKQIGHANWSPQCACCGIQCPGNEEYDLQEYCSQVIEYGRTMWVHDMCFLVDPVVIE